MKRTFLNTLILIGVLFAGIYSSPVSAQNLLDLSVWDVGSGGVGMFTPNGKSIENSREWGIGPYGNRSIIWKATPDGDNQGDGGWTSTDIPINSNKMYRFSVWIKKSEAIEGRTYLGTKNVQNLNGTANGNAYFWSGKLPLLDRWYLLVGYVHASNDPSTESFGAIYDGISGQKVVDMTDFKFLPTATSTNHRAYLFYAPTTADRQYFYGPRLEVVDGNEPTVESLLGISNGQSDLAYFSGKVGIKTTTPRDSDLAVNGKIRASEVKVEAGPWPDYVFEEGYKLRPLAEVEQFIKANKHLPEVPSAQHMEADGLSLGEMNKLMMKKIEELTLHLIQQDIKIKALEKQIEGK